MAPQRHALTRHALCDSKAAPVYWGDADTSVDVMQMENAEHVGPPGEGKHAHLGGAWIRAARAGPAADRRPNSSAVRARADGRVTVAPQNWERSDHARFDMSEVMHRLHRGGPRGEACTRRRCLVTLRPRPFGGRPESLTLRPCNRARARA